jgi:hypothetical protein
VGRGGGEEKQTCIEGVAPPTATSGAAVFGDARPDDATVSRSLFPACLHTCKPRLHNTIPLRESSDRVERNSSYSHFSMLKSDSTVAVPGKTPWLAAHAPTNESGPVVILGS